LQGTQPEPPRFRNDPVVIAMTPLDPAVMDEGAAAPAALNTM
jgi:hypothetical protein